MAALTRSYLKVPYDLRPAKQVERRMLIDALGRLTHAQFPISEYQYTGMGSIYFVDFLLFRKLLGIRRMLSVEADDSIPKRLRFNRPFKDVEICNAPIAEVIPTLSRDRRHLLWLDYDSVIYREHVEDIVNAAAVLSIESILLITLDVEPPDGDGPDDWLQHFRREAEDHLGANIAPQRFRKSFLSKRNCEIVSSAIEQGLTGREARFIPIFHFLYRDGHQMLTVGGMIGTEEQRRRVDTSTLGQTVFFRADLKQPAYEIRVPRLTRKERLYLDGHMPCGKHWAPGQFELSADEVAAYRDIYPFFPAYAELLL